MSESQYTNQGYQGEGESQGGYNNQGEYQEEYTEGNQSGYPKEYSEGNQGGYQEEYTEENQSGYPEEYTEENQGGYNNQGGYLEENQAYNPTYQEGEYTTPINPVETINISNKIASTPKNETIGQPFTIVHTNFGDNQKKLPGDMRQIGIGPENEKALENRQKESVFHNFNSKPKITSSGTSPEVDQKDRKQEKRDELARQKTLKEEREFSIGSSSPSSYSSSDSVSSPTSSSLFKKQKEAKIKETLRRDTSETNKKSQKIGSYNFSDPGKITKNINSVFDKSTLDKLADSKTKKINSTYIKNMKKKNPNNQLYSDISEIISEVKSVNFDMLPLEFQKLIIQEKRIIKYLFRFKQENERAQTAPKSQNQIKADVNINPLQPIFGLGGEFVPPGGDSRTEDEDRVAEKDPGTEDENRGVENNEEIDTK